MEKIAIITIYRNTPDNKRWMELKQFIKKIKVLLKYGQIDLFIIEQSQDRQPFNIGKLKNIGFQKALEHNPFYSFFIFSDIDIIPDKKLCSYYFNLIEGISCLATRGTIYNNRNGSCFMGSCIGIDRKSFEKINGYPNNFWGWGGEDECLLTRCNYKKIKIFEPKIGSIIDLEKKNRFKHNKEKENYKIEKQILDIENQNKNGLNHLNYTILSYTFHNKNNYDCHHYVIDLEYKKDLNDFPEWFQSSKLSKYNFKQIKDFKKKTLKKYKICSPILY